MILRKYWMILALVSVCAVAVRAELLGDAQEFLKDYDRLVALRAEISADRDAMAADINDNAKLRLDVKRFFADRAEALAVRLLKAVDRKQMRLDLSTKLPKVQKPVKGTGDLAQDATSYINSYDAWVAFEQQVLVNIEQMRAAVNANDGATLLVAVTDFFTNSRLRHEKRLQWQLDIKAMKKDTAFKGTGKPHLPPGDSLKDHVSEFLSDRVSWEVLSDLVDADRNNLRAVLGVPDSLASAVTTFLTDRRAHHIKTLELALDRKAMRKDVGLSASAKGENKPGVAATAKNVDRDDEDKTLDESTGAGE
jgi:hypothetical protein